MVPIADERSERREVALVQRHVDVHVRPRDPGERLDRVAADDPPRSPEVAQQIGDLGHRQRIPWPVAALELDVGGVVGGHDQRGRAAAALVAAAVSDVHRLPMVAGRRHVHPSAIGCTMTGMDGPIRRLRPVLGLVVALGLALGPSSVGATATRAAEAAPPAVDGATTSAPVAWDGSINLYRKGVFTTQQTWLWCTAAGVQIVRNIVERDDDHSRRSQDRYFDWMRERNRYDLPVSAGVDPAGWTAGMRRFVDDRYRLIASDTFDEALRLAVIRMRKTSLPVALTVSHGNHGWILHGFAATADPLVTSDFRVTSVRVTGPLWGRQNSSFGYDMRPNTKLTTRQLRTFFTPWKYAPKAMVWDGRYVSIQPVTPRKATTSSGGASPSPTAAPAASPSATVAPPIIRAGGHRVAAPPARRRVPRRATHTVGVAVAPNPTSGANGSPGAVGSPPRLPSSRSRANRRPVARSPCRSSPSDRCSRSSGSSSCDDDIRHGGPGAICRPGTDRAACPGGGGRVATGPAALDRPAECQQSTMSTSAATDARIRCHGRPR